jgi:uncharacterized metal-binding protein
MTQLQATTPAASSGASPVVSMQSMRPMDLLEASLGSVLAAAARKADKTWVTRGENYRLRGKWGLMAAEFEKTLSPDLDLIVSLFGQT